MFKKHPLQNRTNVQIKGGGGQRPFVFKKTALFWWNSTKVCVVFTDLKII